MPLPEHEDKHGADGFLRKLCPIFGEIRRVDEPQGYYRIHRSNFGGDRGTVFNLRRGLNRFSTYADLLARHLSRQGVSVEPADWMGPGSEYQWLTSYLTAHDEINELVAMDEKLILIDDGALGAEFLPGRGVFPFLSSDGHFGGPPHDDREAIREFEKLRARGARLAVVAFPAFWWIEEYPQFFAHLRENYVPIIENERLFVLTLDGPDDLGSCGNDGQRAIDTCLADPPFDHSADRQQ